MRQFQLALFALALLAPAGCTIRVDMPQSQEIARQALVEQSVFYEHLARHYYLQGYEYYSLAQMLEEKQETAKSQEMARRAKMYHALYENAQAAAARAREKAGAPPPPIPAKPAPTKQPE